MGLISTQLGQRYTVRSDVFRLEAMSSDRPLAPWSLSRRAARQCKRSTKVYPETNQESDEPTSTESILHVGFSMGVQWQPCLHRPCFPSLKRANSLDAYISIYDCMNVYMYGMYVSRHSHMACMYGMYTSWRRVTQIANTVCIVCM